MSMNISSSSSSRADGAVWYIYIGISRRPLMGMICRKQTDLSRSSTQIQIPNFPSNFPNYTHHAKMKILFLKTFKSVLYTIRRTHTSHDTPHAADTCQHHSSQRPSIGVSHEQSVGCRGDSGATEPYCCTVRTEFTGGVQSDNYVWLPRIPNQHGPEQTSSRKLRTVKLKNGRPGWTR